MEHKRTGAISISSGGILRRYSWEVMLVVMFIAINIMNMFISVYYWDNWLNATNSFLDRGLMALSMSFVILIGYIDISVASTVTLSSVVMAVCYNEGAGVPMGAAMLICIAVGIVCGLINGLLLAKFRELAPMIVTLCTQIIYRGIAYIILGDQASGKFPNWFVQIGWGAVGPFPIMLLAFIVLFLLFAFVMHKTNYGRTMYAMGKNKTTCAFSGIHTNRLIIINYTLNGLMAAVTALFMSARMGSVRPNTALSYEMDVIAMVVLGGISTAGGKGRMSGLLISIFIVGLIRYGLGLININPQILMMIVGGLLIFAVALPEFMTKLRARKHERLVQEARAAG